MKSDLWVEEKHPNIGLRYKVKDVLFSGQSEFQAVDVVDTFELGRMLLNDGLVMVTEKDEFIYHDMITHIPMFAHPNPKKVLVIGGGDGGTAREVLRHQSVEKCVMVEIDEMVVNASREFIPITSCELDNPKLELIIGDGVKYAKETSEKFDVILVDSTDPIGPAQPLFGSEFYNDLATCLNDQGVIVSQGESPFYEQTMQGKLMSILHDIFPVVSIYNFSNLTYPGGLWSFTYASKGTHPFKGVELSKVQSSNLKFKYYNYELQRSAFMIPEFQKENIAKYFKGMDV